MKRRIVNKTPIFLFICSLVIAPLVQASTLELAPKDSSTWERMLYVEKTLTGGWTGRINQSEFYLSESKLDPKLEFEKSIALFTSEDEIKQKQAICRYTGRFTYLVQRGYLSPSTFNINDCENFVHFAKPDQYNRAYVVMVDGYFGNPASAFGHLVLRLGHSNSNNRLLETTVNYGAALPANENMLAYIAKGIFGGYQAAFGTESFYQQDLNYAYHQSRDMWDYELALTDDEYQLFIAHLWEMIGTNSTYFFIKNNCAFAVAEALSIATGKQLIRPNIPWYAPITLTHTLESHPELIASKTYIPSVASIAQEIKTTLSDEDWHAVKRWVRADVSDLENETSSLSTSATEALITYYSSVSEFDSNNPDEATKRYRQLLLHRLSMPAGKTINIQVPPTMPPGNRSKSTLLYASASSESIALGFSPFSQLSYDLGNKDGSIMKALTVELGVQPKLALNKFQAIQVKQRSNTLAPRLEGWPISWQLDIGWNQDSQLYLTPSLGQTLQYKALSADIWLQPHLAIERVDTRLVSEITLSLPWQSQLSIFAQQSLLSDDAELDVTAALSTNINRAFSAQANWRLSNQSVGITVNYRPR